MEVEKKPRKWPKGKIVAGILLVIVLIAAYEAWQYTTIEPNSPEPIGPAPDFSLMDINGTNLFTLGQFTGKAVALHFMTVGCHGLVYPIDDNQLRQLKSLCSSFCGNDQFVIVTVLWSTCPTSNLSQIRVDYGITWLMGSDYSDGRMDIYGAYQDYSVEDGTIILVDKTLNVTKVHTEAVTASALSSEIQVLLKA
jgi:peroxiredoxin